MIKELESKTNNTGISDSEILALVRQAREGDPEAFAELVRTFQPRLHRHALFLTGDEHSALDLLQQTMVETWKHLQRYDGRASFFTWMCSIMVHRHYDWIRRWRTRAFTILVASPDVTVPSDALDPGESSANSESARMVRECLDELPARQRIIVYLRFYAGESLEGIAAIAQCSIGTVKSRLFHALKRLAKMQKLKEFRTW